MRSNARAKKGNVMKTHGFFSSGKGDGRNDASDETAVCRSSVGARDADERRGRESRVGYRARTAGGGT